MRIETTDDLEKARVHLLRRSPEVLAAFIVSLAHVPNPVGDQVRTFIVGDDVEETVKSVTDRLASLSGPGEYEYRHTRGREIGEKLELIVESIGSLVLPIDPAAAFELLSTVFEQDGEALEQCGDHHSEVEVALQRAADLMAEAAKSLPAAVVTERVRALVVNDDYGMRTALRPLIPPAANTHE